MPARKTAAPGAHAAPSPDNRESEPHLAAALITARDLYRSLHPAAVA